MSWVIVKDIIGKRCQLRFRLMIATLAIIIIPGLLWAATERVIDYQYDNAGNIVRIISQEQSAPPVISSLSPSFINVGRIVSFTAIGSNLFGADVTTDTPGLSVSEVNPSLNQVTFQLTASNTAPIGNAILRFINGLGETQETILIADTPPALATSPAPIAIDHNNTTTSISLIFSQPRPENETYTITTGDVSVADTVASTFTILSGETQVDIALTGFAIGATILNIDLAAKFYTYSFPVFVSKSYSELLAEFPDMGQRNLFANAVGVLVQPDTPFSPNSVLSSPVGVLLDSRGAYFSNAIGVFYGDGFGGSIFSKPVGVAVSNLSSVLSPVVGVNVSDTASFAFSSQVESVLGPLLDNLQPTTATVDTVVNFQVSGFNLGEVTLVSISPATDIVIGAFTVDPGGTLLTVPVTIGLNAILGTREVNLESAIGVISSRSGAPLTFEIQ